MSCRAVALAALLASAWMSVELDRHRHAVGLTPDRQAAGAGSLAGVGVAALGGFRAFVLNALWCRAVDQWMRKEWHLTAGTFRAIETLGSRLPAVYAASAWTTCYSIAGDARAAGDDEAAWRWLQRGLAQLERGRRANPRSARLAYLQSFIHYDQGKQEPYWSRFKAAGVHPLQRARALAREAVTLAPDEPGLRYWLALACRHAAQAARAEGDLETAHAAIDEGRGALIATRRLLPPPADDGDPSLLFFHHRIRASARLLDTLERQLGGPRPEDGR